jgi:hypothetical protein
MAYTLVKINTPTAKLFVSEQHVEDDGTNLQAQLLFQLQRCDADTKDLEHWTLAEWFQVFIVVC